MVPILSNHSFSVERRAFWEAFFFLPTFFDKIQDPFPLFRVSLKLGFFFSSSGV